MPWRAMTFRGRLADQGGQAMLEFTLVVAALIGLVFGAIALLYGLTGALVTTDAARDAARLASIECGSGSPAYFADAEQAAHDDLAAGQQYVAALASPAAESAPEPGEWDFRLTCTATTATATVVYDAPSLFPAVIASTGAAHPGTFTEQSSAAFPVE